MAFQSKFNKPKKGFGTISPDKLKQKINNIGQGSGAKYIKSEIKVFKPKEGNNFIRILPPLETGEDFSMDIFVHEFMGPNGDYFLCAQKMLGERCGFCEQRQVHAMKSVDGMNEKQKETHEKLLYKLAPHKKVIYWILDCGEKPQSPDPMLFPAPPSQIGDAVLRLNIDPKTTELTPVYDPENGFEIYFLKQKKKGTQQWEYVSVQRGNPKSIDNPEEIIAHMVPFEDTLVVPDEDLVDKIAVYYKEGLPQVKEKTPQKKLPPGQQEDMEGEVETEIEEELKVPSRFGTAKKFVPAQKSTGTVKKFKL